MATFLELVNKVGPESGTVSGSLGAIASATGRWAKVVGWTRDAWSQIQRERGDWTFRQKQFSGTLTAGLSEYTAASFGITDFGGWLRDSGALEYDGLRPFSLYDPDRGREDEGHLRVIPHAQWLRSWDLGDPDNQRPTVVAEGPLRTLLFGPPPDKGYIVRGWYKRAVQELTNGEDTPYIDPEFHDAIKWKAIELLAQHDEAEFHLATAGNQYRAVRSQMIRAYVPQVRM